MRVYRSFVDSPLTAGSEVSLDADEAHHLVQVRRARSGDAVILTNGRGTLAEGILRVEGKRAAVQIERILRNESSQPPATIVACALTKSGAFEDILQRAVELGMTHFVPLITERTVVEFDDRRAEKKQEKWARHAIEALKQCERIWLPTIAPPTDFGDFLREQSGTSDLLFLEERTADIALLSDLAPRLRPRPVALILGPEGGWSDDEKRAAREAGATPASLGTSAILRTETAWLAALAVLGR